MKEFIELVCGMRSALSSFYTRLSHLRTRTRTTALGSPSKAKKLAAYAGRQFAEIYADFCFKPKSEETKG